MGEDKWLDTSYYYDGTNVLKNKLGIKNFQELDDIERELSKWRIEELSNLRNENLSLNFNYDHLKEIHSFIFQDLYNWAGQPRTIDIAKSHLFCLTPYIEKSAKDIFNRLNQENNLSGLNKNEFVNRLAEYMGDINCLHPFREGNGRTQRQFFKELAQQAGHKIDFSMVDKNRLLNADIEAMKGNPEPLEDVLQNIVDRKTEKNLDRNNDEKIKRVLEPDIKKSITIADRKKELPSRKINQENKKQPEQKSFSYDTTKLNDLMGKNSRQRTPEKERGLDHER